MMAMEKTEITPISMIDSVNLQSVQYTMQKIAQFQAIVQKTLKPNHDYGIIPGTGDKPTLLKPGAEKILMLFGLTSEFEEIERVQDYEKGFFAFTVKCVLSKNGHKVTEGVGHANTREKKYVKQDPYSIANTVLKMAKKRALIDATLTVAALSEIFTQDLEDDIEGTPVEEKASQNQIKFIHKLLNEKKISDDEYRARLKELYGVESSTELTKEQASDLISRLQKAHTKENVKAAAGDENVGA